MNYNSENKQAETFKICPYNPGLLAGYKGTIKNKDTEEVLEQTKSGTGYLIVKNPMITFKNKRKYELVH